MLTEPQLPQQAAHLLEGGDFGVVEVLHVSDKAVVAAGIWRGHPTVVKIRLGDDSYWAQRQRAERGVYAALAGQGPAVRTARQLYANDRMIILDRLAGNVLGTGRYPSDVTAADAAAAMDALTRLHQWRPPARALDAFPRTRVDVHRALATSGLGDRDAHAVDVLLARCGKLRVEHGDPLASNFLTDGGAPIAVVDFEHTGWHLPGTDWALMSLLWTPAQPDLQARLQAAVDRERVHDGYAVALVAYACHEFTLHRSFGAATVAGRRTVLEANLARARDSLHDTLDRPPP